MCPHCNGLRVNVVPFTEDKIPLRFIGINYRDICGTGDHFISFLSQSHDSSSRPDIFSDQNEKNTFLLLFTLMKIKLRVEGHQFWSLRPQFHHIGLS